MISDRRANQTQSDYRVAQDSPLATSRLPHESGTKKSRNWLPIFGIVLIVAGVLFFAATSGVAAAKFLLGLWPLFALIAGVAAVMGFAVDRKPRSPVGGMLLLFVGALFSIARFDSGLNPIQIYGRYWIVLLGIFAAVELVRYYSHRQTDGKPPRLFGVGRMLVITLIVGTGVVANRAAMNGELLGSLRLPGFLDTILDSALGDRYTFTDEAATLANLPPGSRVIINNPYGNVKVSGAAASARATLVQVVRARNQEKAKEVADQINLDVSETGPNEYTLTTNREEVKEVFKGQFNTDIQLDVPPSVSVTVTSSYGTVAASKIEGLTVTAKYGKVEASDIMGNLAFNLTSTDVTAANVKGNIVISGGDDVRLSNVSGSVEVGAKNGSVDLQAVSGAVKVDAPYSRITARDLAQKAVLKTQSSRVTVSKAAGVSIEAPNSNITATDISGDLKIETSQKNVEVKDLSGNLTLDADHTNVSADGIQGIAVIKTSHGKVEVKNFRGAMKIETSYRDVFVSAPGEIAGDIIVENSHGEIKADLPLGGNYRIEAESDSGRVRATGFDTSSSRDRERFTYSSGSGAPLVSLKTTYDTITVRAVGTRVAPPPPPTPSTPAGPTTPLPADAPKPIPPNASRDRQPGLQEKR